MERDCNSTKIPGGEESYVGDPLRFELSGKIMLIAIVVLFSIAALILSLHLYTRYVLRHRQRRNHPRQLHHHRSWHLLLFPLHRHPPTTTSRGLDASVLASLPVFAFSSKTHQTSLECAVCLSEFEEDEKGRLLPECNHSFHIDCIDMWFLSHSSCPLCRASVIPELPEKSTHVSANRADGDPEVGSGSGFCSSSRVGQETGSSSSSSSTSSSSLSSVVFF